MSGIKPRRIGLFTYSLTSAILAWLCAKTNQPIGAALATGAALVSAIAYSVFSVIDKWEDS